MIRRTAVGLAALGILTGCSVTIGSDAEPAVETPDDSSIEMPESLPTDSPATPREIFLAVLAEEAPDMYASAPDDDLIALVETMCEGFDAGLTREDIIVHGAASGYTGYDIGVLMGAGTVTYCPEHQDKIEP